MAPTKKNKAIVKKISTPKPDFKRFIAGATSVGSWSIGSKGDIVECIEDGIYEDAAVRQAIAGMSLADGTNAETVYLTLLAWYILEECYYDDQDQWHLIAGKAKSWLESVGVLKPANLIQKFTLTLK